MTNSGCQCPCCFYFKTRSRDGVEVRVALMGLMYVIMCTKFVVGFCPCSKHFSP